MSTVLRKNVGAIVLAVMFTACCMPAIAEAFVPGDGRPGKGFDRPNQHRLFLGTWRNPQIVEKLKLTESQVKQLRDLDFSHRETVLPLKSQIESNRLKMDKAMSADMVDRKAVLTAAKKIADLKGKIFVQTTEARLAVKKILTDDQINELKDLSRQKRKHGPRPPRNYVPDCK